MNEVLTRRAVIDDSPRACIARVLTGAGVPADVAAGYADLVCAEFAGEDIYFAIRQWKNLDERDRQIRTAYQAGRSQRALGQEFCISRAQVQRILCGGR